MFYCISIFFTVIQSCISWCIVKRYLCIDEKAEINYARNRKICLLYYFLHYMCIYAKISLGNIEGHLNLKVKDGESAV